MSETLRLLAEQPGTDLAIQSGALALLPFGAKDGLLTSCTPIDMAKATTTGTIDTDIPGKTVTDTKTDD